MQLNLEIRARIAIDVAFDNRVPAVLEETELSRGRKRIRADERKRLIARSIEVGIDIAEVNDVASGEVLDYVATCRRARVESRKARAEERERILAHAPRHVVDTGAADDPVVTLAADQRVVAGAAVEGESNSTGGERRGVDDIIANSAVDGSSLLGWRQVREWFEAKRR